ncbi:MAG TPA: hypothetical protein PLS29_01905 [Acidimicrobiales bacterium]|nr:hypothetical protein [Acidimicrobiales bacterium]
MKLDRLMRNALALMISSGGSAVLGLVFWIVAAHAASTAVVGKTTATIAAMLLLATLAQLSFGSIFERFLPVAGDLTRSFVQRSYVLTVSTAVILTVGYIALGFGHRFLPAALGWKAFFVVAVVLWTIFALQDSVLVGLRASKWVAVENIGYGLAKLALLPVFLLVSRSQGIFVAWIIPVAVALAGVSWYLFRRRIPSHMAASARTEDLPTTRELFWLSSAQYASLLSTVFLPSIVTLIVIARLGAVANAHYYLPAMIATNLEALAFSVVRSFLVEASSEPHALKAHADSAIRGLAAVMVPGVVLGIIFAPVYLRVFGDAYAQHGTDLMRMLLLSQVGTSVMVFYSTFAWLDKRLWWITARNVTFSAIYLVVIESLIGRLGINAIGVASLIWGGLTVAIFLPASIRRYRQIAAPLSASTE